MDPASASVGGALGTPGTRPAGRPPLPQTRRGLQRPRSPGHRPGTTGSVAPGRTACLHLLRPGQGQPQRRGILALPEPDRDWIARQLKTLAQGAKACRAPRIRVRAPRGMYCGVACRTRTRVGQERRARCGSRTHRSSCRSPTPGSPARVAFLWRGLLVGHRGLGSRIVRTGGNPATNQSHLPTRRLRGQPGPARDGTRPGRGSARTQIATRRIRG
jgi:hypothetical protein